jgi:hypothetical protein
MFNYFDIVFAVAAAIAGSAGYYVGIFIEAYLFVLSMAILLLVKSVFVMDRTKAYIVFFLGTILLTIISVSFIGVIYTQCSRYPLLKWVHRLFGVVVVVIFMLMICRIFVLPVSLRVSEIVHREVTQSYTVNNLVPLIGDILPGFQDNLWNVANSLLPPETIKPQEMPASPLAPGKKEGGALSPRKRKR